MTTTTFELGDFVRSVEERDAAGQLLRYADDALVSIVDANASPSSPCQLAGHHAIEEWVSDISSRDMTHRVAWTAREGDRAAFVENCEYPNGSKVLCMTTLDIVDGRIAKQLVSQVWDA